MERFSDAEIQEVFARIGNNRNLLELQNIQNLPSKDIPVAETNYQSRF
jgi:hypothetical protein